MARTFSTTAKIAHGGMATIHAGVMRTAAAGEERVAIKVLHPHLAEDAHVRRMFLHEARLARRLAHANVVRVLDHGEDDEHGAFIVMELVEGVDLAALLKGSEDRPLPPRVVVRLVLDLLAGLHAAHELTGEDGEPLRLIHRDVSPHNVLVGTDGVARLTDFGIAKSDERYTATRPGELKGKLAYMAPEQLAHEDALDRRVDVFAAGVVSWEALTARRLFRGEDDLSIINQVLLAKVPPPSSVRAELAPLDEVVERALAREPEERWPSAEAMAAALEEASAALGGPASREQVRAALLERAGDRIAELAARIADAAPSELGRREAAPRARAAKWPALIALALLSALAVGWLVHDAARDERAPSPAAASRPPPPPSAPAPTATDDAIAREPAPRAAPAPERDDEPHAAHDPAPPPARRAPRRAPAAVEAPQPAAPAAPPPAAPEAAAAPPDDLIPNPYGD